MRSMKPMKEKDKQVPRDPQKSKADLQDTPTDAEMIELFFARSESALVDCQRKYGRYCHAIAERILGSPQDAEECVNDTWMRAWCSIPPARPARLSAYLGAITRHLAIDRLEEAHAKKRGGGETAEVSEEFWDCLPSAEGNIPDEVAFSDAMNRFLGALDRRTRVVFLQRYWYIVPVREIAEGQGMSEGAVKTLLHRTREKLKAFLEKEGISV